VLAAFFPAFPREDLPVSDTARNAPFPALSSRSHPSFAAPRSQHQAIRAPAPDQVAAPPSDRNEISAPTVPVADKSSGNPFFTPRSTSSNRCAETLQHSDSGS